MIAQGKCNMISLNVRGLRNRIKRRLKYFVIPGTKLDRKHWWSFSYARLV